MATKAKAKKKMKPAKAVKKAKAVVKSKAAKKPLKAAKPAAKAKPVSAGRVRAAMNLITPLEDRVIVRVEIPEQMTAGGIIIPGVASERPNRGEVIAAGPGRRNKKGKLRPLDVGVGDNVLFPQYSGTRINVGDEEFLILREEEVLGILTT